ncbi:hypothetical protein [Actinoplanes sp. N902-109]|uniref:hypothetical protein n=1 Tax=Actinoplanes sp. (strain N902-109) TaxID=649831 RepID=UPI0003295836|nr:hypothetical protein [Actinoplanes sp. N902-109]AGL19520.1 hypothetical protein L083_6010 [Actinoplanes sp. N902-109]
MTAAKKSQPRWTAASLGVRPFQIPRCASCQAGLCDSAGNPRWDVLSGMRLVCLGCRRRPGAMPRKAVTARG